MEARPRGLHDRITVTTSIYEIGLSRKFDQFIMLVRIYYIRACTPGSRSRRHSERPWMSRNPAQNWPLYINTYFGPMYVRHSLGRRSAFTDLYRICSL